MVEAFALAMLFVLREYLIYRICRLLVFANAVQCSRTSSGATNGLPALTSTGVELRFHIRVGRCRGSLGLAGTVAALEANTKSYSA